MPFKSMVHPLPVEREFAGFSWPKYAWMLPKGTLKKRLERARNNICGPYYGGCTPVQEQAGHGGTCFYLESDFMPQLRWEWADEVNGSRINHRGWYTDEFGDGDKIRGIVMRLPRNRGFLAGWSMGEGMASTVEYDIYDDALWAASSADSLAKSVAEREREYQAEEAARREAEEAEIEAEESEAMAQRDIITTP
jgi:hypothetical protein